MQLQKERKKRSAPCLKNIRREIIFYVILARIDEIEIINW